METIDFKTVIPKFDFILARGLRAGLGMGPEYKDGEQMCVEAAVCAALGLPHGDDPKCVASSVRSYIIRINDSNWSSSISRATHLRDLGIAQLGSLGVVNDLKFIRMLASKTIKILIPLLLRSICPDAAAVMLAADQCEKYGSCDAAKAAAKAAAEATNVDSAAAAYKAADAATNAANIANAAAHAAYAAKAAAYSAYAAIAADAADAAKAAAHATKAAKICKESGDPKELDKYLILSAQLALETLQELDSPGAISLALHGETD